MSHLVYVFEASTGEVGEGRRAYSVANGFIGRTTCKNTSNSRQPQEKSSVRAAKPLNMSLVWSLVPIALFDSTQPVSHLSRMKNCD